MLKRFFLSREILLFAVLVTLFVGFSLFVDGFWNWFYLFKRTRYWVAAGMIAVINRLTLSAFPKYTHTVVCCWVF